MDAAAFEAALSAPLLGSLNADVKQFLLQSFKEGCTDAVELTDLLSPYLLDSGLATDEADADRICRRIFPCSENCSDLPLAAAEPGLIGRTSLESAAPAPKEEELLPKARSNGYATATKAKSKQVTSKKATSRLGRGKKEAVSAARVPGAELQLRDYADADAAADAVAKALRAHSRALDSSGGPGADYIGASFVAYAQEKEPRRLQAWREILGEVLADANAQLDEDEVDHAAAVERVVEQLIKVGALELRERVLEVGEQVLALLSEDDDWHLAIVDALLEKEQVRIVFIEYGKPQDVQVSDVRMMDNVVDDDGEDLEEGHCEMCRRYLLLTFHHLIPKDTHRKYIGKKLPKGVEGEPTRWFLNTHGTMICRSCHSTVHHFASNDVLGAEYNTLEKLLAEPYIQRWVEFAKNRKPALK